MNDFERLQIVYQLKEIERKGTVAGKRYESAAEHVFSSLVLSRYFLKKVKDLDEKRVMELLMYHDMVEVYAGDTFILDEEMAKSKKQREKQALIKLEEELPSEIRSELKSAWDEFEDGKTKEAKFCKAVEELDPILHSMNKPEEWKEHGFTEKVLRNKKEHHMKEVPEIYEFFNSLVEYLKNKKIIPEK